MKTNAFANQNYADYRTVFYTVIDRLTEDTAESALTMDLLVRGNVICEFNYNILYFISDICVTNVDIIAKEQRFFTTLATTKL